MAKFTAENSLGDRFALEVDPARLVKEAKTMHAHLRFCGATCMERWPLLEYGTLSREATVDIHEWGFTPTLRVLSWGAVELAFVSPENRRYDLDFEIGKVE